MSEVWQIPCISHLTDVRVYVCMYVRLCVRIGGQRQHQCWPSALHCLPRRAIDSFCVPTSAPCCPCHVCWRLPDVLARTQVDESPGWCQEPGLKVPSLPLTGPGL